MARFSDEWLRELYAKNPILDVVSVVSLLSPKMNADHIDKVFDCYNQKVTVEKRYSLEEDENETEDEEEEDIQNRLDA